MLCCLALVPDASCNCICARPRCPDVAKFLARLQVAIAKKTRERLGLPKLASAPWMHAGCWQRQLLCRCLRSQRLRAACSTRLQDDAALQGPIWKAMQRRTGNAAAAGAPPSAPAPGEPKVGSLLVSYCACPSQLLYGIDLLAPV